MLVSGRESNFEEGRMMHCVYFTAALDAATWGAELASGEGPGRIYLVELTGDRDQVARLFYPALALLPFARAHRR